MKKFLVMISITIVSAFLMQGFQCGSTKEMVAAKQFIKQEKYDEAEEQLRTHLAVNIPNDEQALLMLIDINIKRNNLVEAAKMLNDLKGKLKTKKYIDQYKRIVSETWRNAYNNGITYYQRGYQEKSDILLDSAIYQFEVGYTIRPKLVYFYYISGLCYFQKGDTVNALASYDKYINGLDEEINFGFENGLRLGLEPEEAFAKIDTESLKTVRDTTSNATRRVDKLMTKDSTELYLYFQDTDKSGDKLDGWRINFSDDWQEVEKLTYKSILTDPFATIAELSYVSKDYERALGVLKKFQKIDPFNQSVNSSIVDLYKTTGKGDVAIAELSELTETNKDNPLYPVMWGDLLANTGKTKLAIEKYKIALERDGNYAFAHRNMAYTYKNMAAEAQKPEVEKKRKDRNYVVDTTAYFPFLRLATSSFERALKTEQFKNDPDVMGELANIYQSLNENDEMWRMIKMMEEIENLIPQGRKLAYYDHLFRVYSYIKPQTPEIQQKLNEITKKQDRLTGG